MVFGRDHVECTIHGFEKGCGLSICMYIYMYISIDVKNVCIYSVYVLLNDGMLDSAMGIHSILPKFKLRRTAIYRTGTNMGTALIESP